MRQGRELGGVAPRELLGRTAERPEQEGSMRSQVPEPAARLSLSSLAFLGLWL